jgi:hypothetical protein
MGSQCQSTSTVVAPQGPTATELSAAKDQQIETLKKQAEEQKAQRAREQAEASKAASSIKGGILKANAYQPAGPPTDAINEEAKVALTRLPSDDPAETVASLERAIKMIEGKREEALALYAAARKEAEVKQQVIVAKDKELEKRDQEISKRDAEIADLTRAAQIEREKAAADLAAALAKKDKELADFKAEMASKERRWWINATRIAGLGLILIGVLAMIVLKAIPEGAALTGSGILIGLISIFIDWLTAQWLFPWLCGLILLVILGAGSYAIYRMWRTKNLNDLKTAAIQDQRDESAILGDDRWEKFSEHLKYRMGDKNSFWGKAQMKEVAALGLVNPAGEKAIETGSQSTPKT